MENTKLASLLNSFSATDWRLFKDYVYAPFFNKSEKLQLLFDHIYQYHKRTNSFPNTKLIWKKIYRTEAYNKRRMEALQTDLNKLAEGFIAYQDFREGNKGLNYKLHLLRAARKRELDKVFSLTQKTIDKQLAKLSWKTPDQLYFEYLLLLEIDYMNMEKSNTPRNLNGMIEKLIESFVLNLLYKYCTLFNRKRIINLKLSVESVDPLLTYLNSTDFSHIPPILLYKKLLLSLLEPHKEPLFRAFVEQMDLLIDTLPEEQLYVLSIFRLNWLSKKINDGYSEYQQETFNFYLLLLEKDRILTPEGILRLGSFKNIITSALRLGKLDWAEKFIHQYKNKLPEHSQEASYRYNMAAIHFAREEFRAAVELVKEVKFNFLPYNLNKESLLLKSYYELGAIEDMTRVSNRFDKYIRNNKQISKEIQFQYLNFIKYIKKISKIERGNQLKINILEKELQKQKQVFHIAWFYQKLAQKK